MTKPLALGAIAGVLGVVMLIAINRNAPDVGKTSSGKPVTEQQRSTDRTVTIAPSTPPPVPDRIAIAPKISAPARPAVVLTKPSTRPSAKKQATPQPAPAIEPLFPHEVAREALGSVGFDAGAEFVWAQAINDPALSEDQRRNLIEDLNEDGFPDPKNITVEDVPLIESRMQLIDQLAPDAMDQVNSDAFDEAYKDLSNMLKRLSRS